MGLKDEAGHATLEVVSELAQHSIAAPITPDPPAGPASAAQVSERLAAYGIHPLPKRDGIVTNDLIDRLRNAEGI